MFQILSFMQPLAEILDESGVKSHLLLSCTLQAWHVAHTHCLILALSQKIQSLSMCMLPERVNSSAAALMSSCPLAGMAIPAACERPPVDALSAGSIEQQQHAGSSFAATTSALQNATRAASVAAPVLQQAALLAWAGLEGGLDMCGATMQSAPLVGRLAGLPEPASSGPSRPVRLLRWGIAGVYGTAGALKGIRDGIAQLRGQH